MSLTPLIRSVRAVARNHNQGHSRSIRPRTARSVFRKKHVPWLDKRDSAPCDTCQFYRPVLLNSASKPAGRQGSCTRVDGLKFPPQKQTCLPVAAARSVYRRPPLARPSLHFYLQLANFPCAEPTKVLPQISWSGRTRRRGGTTSEIPGEP